MCGGAVSSPTQEVDCVIVMRVWWNAVDVIQCCQGCIVIVCGLPVVAQNFLQNGCNRMVMLWVCPDPA